MRYLFGFLCVCAIGLMSTVGCGPETGVMLCQGVMCDDDGNECTDDVCNPADGTCGVPVEDGTVCSELTPKRGECLDGVCAPVGAFPCTEQGIRDAVAAAGGPHFFACDGPQTIATKSTIEVTKHVSLFGEGNITVDGNANEAGEGHPVFSVDTGDDLGLELRGVGVTGGGCPSGSTCVATGIVLEEGSFLSLNESVVWNNAHGGIYKKGGANLFLYSSTVADNGSLNVHNGGGILEIVRSTVSGGDAARPEDAVGIRNSGRLMMRNSTVSEGPGVGILQSGNTARLLNATVSSNAGVGLQASDGSVVNVRATIVDGVCSHDLASSVISEGYNIESTDDTCGFDQLTDQVEVRTEDLNLGPLAANGGPTMTHALLTEPVVSVAIDAIPEAECLDGDEPVDYDQRGEWRYGQPCDVGAFERQPEDP